MWNWIKDLPTTNVRILVSIALASLYVIVLLVAIVLGKHTDLETITTLGVFLLTMMGLDVAQYIQKRKTFQGDPTGVAAPPEAAAPEPVPPTPPATFTITERTD